MSTVYATSTISLRQQVVAALLKGLTTTVTTTGTAGDPTLVIGTSSFVNTVGTTVTLTGQGTTSVACTSTGALVACDLPVANISQSGATLTVDTASTTGTNTGTGTAANAAIVDKNGLVIVGGLTVGTSAADIILATTSLASGATTTITSNVITGH